MASVSNAPRKKTSKKAPKKRKKSVSNSSGRRSSRSNARLGSNRKPSRKFSPPIRREVSGIILLVLSLCVLVSYFGISAIFVDWIATIIKGLIGYGYWLSVPALLIAARILLFHHGNPVSLRVTCTLLIPVQLGVMFHMLLCQETYHGARGILGRLWITGNKLISGGALSGTLAELSIAIFSKAASLLIGILLLTILVMGIFEMTPAALSELHQQRPRYQPEAYPTRNQAYNQKRPVKKNPAGNQTKKPKRPPKPEPAYRKSGSPKTSGKRRNITIDIPLDGEIRTRGSTGFQARQIQDQEIGQFTSFFRHRSDSQKTPDQVLLDSTATPDSPHIQSPAESPDSFDYSSSDTRSGRKPGRKPKSSAPKSHRIATAPDIPEQKSKRKSDKPDKIEKIDQIEETEDIEQEPSDKKQSARAFIAKLEEIARKKALSDDAYQFPTLKLPKKAPEKKSEKNNQTEPSDTSINTDDLFPPITLLSENQTGSYTEAGAELRRNFARLAETLTSFGVKASPGDVIRGPSVTRYEFVLEQGVRLSKITKLTDDIALSLGAVSVRIAPVPGKVSVVGIEVPNRQVTPVLIRDVIGSREFIAHKSRTAFALGRDIGGKQVIGDIEKLPHILIAGTTGSGKSVCMNTLIVSLLYKSTPDEVRFVMIDPKMVELAPYDGIPHLQCPVITDPGKAAGALRYTAEKLMMKRYEAFKKYGVKKLEEYNQLAQKQINSGEISSKDLKPKPSIIVIIDELADLMLVAAKEVEDSICRIAQMGRAAGIHLVIATQRPSSDVITGLIKANIPSRIAFTVASSLESRIILDNTGAEKLVGRGDMLYSPLGAGKPTRVQGCFISPEEIDRVVEFVKQTSEENACYGYDQDMIKAMQDESDEVDPFDQDESNREHSLF